MGKGRGFGYLKGTAESEAFVGGFGYVSGTAEQVIQKLDDIWWAERYKQVEQLKIELGFDFLENMPQDLRNQLINGHMGVVNSGEEDVNILELKRFKSKNVDGQEYEVVCADKHYNKVKKLSKRMYEDCRDFVGCISHEPRGETLERSHNTKYFHKLNHNSKLKMKVKYKVALHFDSYQYRIGEYRIYWYVNDSEKWSHIFEFAHRATIQKKLDYRSTKS